MGCVQSYFRKGSYDVYEAHSAGLSPSSTQGSDKPPLIGNSTDEDALLDKDLVIVDANEVKLAQQQDGDAEKKPEAETKKSPTSDGAAKPVAAEKADEKKTNAVPAGTKSPPKSAVRPEDVITAAPVPTPAPAPEKDGEGGPRHARRPSSSTSNVSLSGATIAAVQPIASFPETPEPAKADKIAADKGPEFPVKGTTSPTTVAAEVKQERPSSSEKSAAGSPVVTSVEVKQEAKPASPTTPPEAKEAAKTESVSGEEKPVSPVSDKDASTVQSPGAKSPEPTEEVVPASPAVKTEEKPESPAAEEKGAPAKSDRPSSGVTEVTIVTPEAPEAAEKEAAATPTVPAPEEKLPEPPTAVPASDESVPEPPTADVRPVERPSAIPDIPPPSPETGELATTSAVTPTTVLVTPSADGPASPTAGSPETGEIPTPTVSITVSPAPDRTPTSSDDEEQIVIPPRQQKRKVPTESPTTSADQEAPSAAPHDSPKQATDTESVDEVVPSSPNRALSEATTASMVESRQDSRADTPHSVQATAGSELEDSTVDEEVLGAAAAKIQAGFRGYKTRRELKNGSMSESREEKQSEQLKDESKTSEAAEEPAVLEAAATKIQATIRGHQTRQKLKEEGVITTKDDSVVIDANADADKETKAESPVGENDTAELELAATKIQATFRGYKTRKEVLKDDLKQASTDGTGKEVSTDQVAKDQQPEVNEAVVLDGDPSALESAATTIQATFRGFKTRQELQKEGKTEAAEESGKAKDVVQEKIEAEEKKPDAKELEVGETRKTESKEENVEAKGTKPEIGGEKTETDVGKGVKDVKVDDPSVIESAATTIQAAFKGYQTRQQFKKEELVDSAKDIADDAVVTVAAKAESVVQDGAVSPVIESAATTIQAAFRGHKTRQQLKKKEDGDNKEDSGEDKASTAQAPEVSVATDDPALHAAAASIQATFRGYKTHQQLKSEGKGGSGDVTPEQPSVEQQLAEACQEAGSDLEAAATTIQANFRGFQTRKELQKVKEPNSETGEAAAQPQSRLPQAASPEGAAYHDRVLDAAATTIQATFRGFQTRQKVAKPGEPAADDKQAAPQSDAAPEEACVPPLEDMLKTAPAPAVAALPLETSTSLSRASTLEASVPPVEDAVAVAATAAAPREAVPPPEASVPPPEDALPSQPQPQPQPLSAQSSLAESLHEAAVPPLEDLLEKTAPAQARQPASFSSHVSLTDNVPDTETVDVPDSKPAAIAAAVSAAGNTAEAEKTTPQSPTSDAADKVGVEPSREPEPNSRIGGEKHDPESSATEPKPNETAAATAPQPPSGAIADSAQKTEPSSSDGPALEATEAKDTTKTVPSLVAQAEKEVSKLAMASVEAPSAQESVAKEPEAEVKKEQSVAAEISGKGDVAQSVPKAGEKDMKKEAADKEELKGEAPAVPDLPEKVAEEAAKASQEAKGGDASEKVQVESTPTEAVPVVKPPSPKEATAPATSDPAPKAAEEVVPPAVAELVSLQVAGISKDETGSVESLPEPPTAPLSPKDRSSPPSEAGEALSSDAALPSPPLSSQTSLSESLPAATSAPPPLASASAAAAEDSPLTSTATPEPPSEDALPPPPGQGSSRSDSEATPMPEAEAETASVASVSASGPLAAEDSQASLPPPPPPQAAQGDSPPDSASVGAGAADGDSSLPPPPDNDNNSLTDVSMVTDTASEAGDAQIPRSPETGEQKKRPSQVEGVSALQRRQECAELPHQQRGAVPLDNSPDDLAELDEDESVSSSSVDSAATKIQAGVRGFLTRKKVQRMRSTQVSSPAAGAMQAGVMGMSLDSAMPKAASAAASAVATRSAEVLEEDGEVWDTLRKEMDAAATTIQGGVRQFQARQKLTRAEAVRAASSGSSGSGGGSLDQPTLSPGPGSGELHDSLVLPPPPPPPQDQQ